MIIYLTQISPRARWSFGSHRPPLHHRDATIPEDF